MPSILLKSIFPKRMNISQYKKEIISVLKKEGIQIGRLYKSSSSTWQPAVKFETKLSTSLREIKIRVSTRDIRFISIDKGTNTRWAVMSPDFSPKSQVRSLNAGKGRGGAVIRGKTAMVKRNIAPRPGIKPRDFSKEILKIRKPIFFFNMRRAMKRAAKGTF